jgi:hypothetical protein
MNASCLDSVILLALNKGVYNTFKTHYIVVWFILSDISHVMWYCYAPYWSPRIRDPAQKLRTLGCSSTHNNTLQALQK